MEKITMKLNTRSDAEWIRDIFIQRGANYKQWDLDSTGHYYSLDENNMSRCVKEILPGHRVITCKEELNQILEIY